MAETQFTEALARQWQREVEALNQETDMLLKQVAQCISEVQTESEGEFVDKLAKLAIELTSDFTSLISAMNDVVSKLDEIINILQQGVEQVVEGVVGAAGKMLGGILLG